MIDSDDLYPYRQVMASLLTHGQQDVQESPVRHDAVGMSPQSLDVGEDVVPPPAVEASRVLA